MRSAAACLLTLLALGVAAPAQAAVDVYFLQGDQVVPVERAGSTVQEAITRVIEGCAQFGMILAPK